MWIGIVLTAVILAVLIWYVVAQEDNELAKTAVSNQLIVKFKEGIAPERMNAIHRKYRCEVMEEQKALGYYVLSSKRSTRWMMSKYNKLDEVDYAEPNYKFQAFLTPNDTYFQAYQYGPQRISAPSAWDVTTSSSNIRIAVIDSGVQLNHPDLSGKLLPGYDFVSRDGLPEDGNGHGTHVAGIAAAATNNARGIAGIAPNASILPVRVLDNSGSGSLATVANGIIYAADQGAQVINLSLGSTSGALTLQNAINYAWNKGAVLVAAAGNDGVSTPNFPAYYTNVIAVASTDETDNKSPFSNYGSWVEVAAPGSAILSTYTGGYYAYLDGTSMASPHVAGLAALLAAQGWTNLQIRNVICNTSDPISGTGIYWRFGRVNAARAVSSPVNPQL
ncbi:S8 family peptidase [Paenibacillus gansuensis]|uniref:S8 family peptidase n=1 Tax=Paenibacillus gansuensis TaxID=306542 RepID=A0ABW5P897_9BACL